MPFSAHYLRSLKIAGAAGAAAVCVAVLVGIGWLTGNQTLLRVKAEWTPMVPMTATAFLLSGVSLLLIVLTMKRRRLIEQTQSHRGRRTAMALGLLVMLIGARRLVYYAMEWPTRADMLGFDRGETPGQMAFMTAVGFLLAGAALVVTARRGFYRSAQWLAAAVIFIGWIGMTRYFYGGETQGVFFLMAMHTAMMFAVLGMGIFYARPDGGFMMVWNSDTAGGVLVRRLFPAAMIVPVVVGWLRLHGERLGWYGLETGLTIFAMSNVMIFAVLAWHTASRLHQQDVGRRQAEKTTQSEQQFSNAVIDSLPGAFYLYDLRGKFLRWNRNFEQVSGYSAEEIARMKPLDFIVERDRPLVADRIGEVFSKGKSEVESGLLVKGGAEIPYFFTGVTLMLNGEPCLAGVGIDITELKKAEQAVHELNQDLERRVVQRTAELNAKNRELETFTYSVSHDLKAPLRGIDGYSRLLQEDYGHLMDEEGRRFLASVRQATSQMGQLIDDLLEYSRLERRTITVSAVKPLAILNALPVGYMDEIRDRGIKFSAALPDAAVLADPSGLSQVLRNLLDNALKFTRAVPEPAIEIGGRIEDGSMILWVKDNGIGFDMKFANRIFDIFQRLHRSEDYPGTGIGLAIVRKAMERMNGSVHAESAPGSGATFYLKLPLCIS